ncbi:unnamed protein product [Clavelina lepadiformis]|uniref:Kinetochore protein Spc24 n=1 Tax=Clavelina lepadiformis TaxID=159417 RepID=A0ABP0EYF6_CLALP
MDLINESKKGLKDFLEELQNKSSFADLEEGNASAASQDADILTEIEHIENAQQLRWDNLQQAHANQQSSLESLWEEQHALKQLINDVDKEVMSLKEKEKESLCKLENLEQSRLAVAQARQEANMESLDIARQTLFGARREQSINQLVKLIAPIKWDSPDTSNPNIVRATIVQKSGVKSLTFDRSGESAGDIGNKLWNVLEDGENFIGTESST